MTTWNSVNKNSSSWQEASKSGSEIIYLVSEALDYYLVGSSEDETLITQDLISWSSPIKN